MGKEICLCDKMLSSEAGRVVKATFHLYGCPESYTTKNYDTLPWYKRLLTGNPRSIYKIHMQQTGVYN